MRFARWELSSSLPLPILVESIPLTTCKHNSFLGSVSCGVHVYSEELSSPLAILGHSSPLKAVPSATKVDQYVLLLTAECNIVSAVQLPWETGRKMILPNPAALLKLELLGNRYPICIRKRKALLIHFDSNIFPLAISWVPIRCYFSTYDNTRKYIDFIST